MQTCHVIRNNVAEGGRRGKALLEGGHLAAVFVAAFGFVELLGNAGKFGDGEGEAGVVGVFGPRALEKVFEEEDVAGDTEGEWLGTMWIRIKYSLCH